MLPGPADVQTPPEKRRSKQPEVDSVSAMKRFLVRADVMAARKCHAADPENATPLTPEEVTRIDQILAGHD